AGALKHFNNEMKEAVKATNDMKARVKGNAPEQPLSAYAGTYKNELFGTIHITAIKKNLHVTFDNHVNFNADLKYMDNGEWMLPYSNLSYGIFPLEVIIENG